MTTPPLPPHALGKVHQYRLVKDVRGVTHWVLRKRFRTSKHRGACAGAFGKAAIKRVPDTVAPQPMTAATQ